MAKSVLERFEEKVMVDPNSGCWLWTGFVTPEGYGQFFGAANQTKKAHRWGFSLHRGPIPDGMDLDHKCRVRSCVNPDHLEPVTRKENLRRGIRTTIANDRFSSRTHCKNGHSVTAESGRERNYGGRRYFQCLICLRERVRAKKALSG